MNIAVNKSKRTVEIIEEGFESLNRFGKIPGFVPVGEAVRILGEGTKEAIQHQERRGPKGEEFDIYYSDNIIQLKIKPLSFETPHPLLWFLPLDLEKGFSIFKETHRPEETDYLLAELSTDELKDKDLDSYTILLEEQKTKTN